jgi:hypothetical protein
MSRDKRNTTYARTFYTSYSQLLLGILILIYRFFIIRVANKIMPIINMPKLTGTIYTALIKTTPLCFLFGLATLISYYSTYIYIYILLEIFKSGNSMISYKRSRIELSL